MTHKSTRRDFLKGRSAVDPAADLAEGRLAPETAPASHADPLAETYLVHVGRLAMASQFEVLLNAGQYEHGTEAALEALDLLGPLEDQLSVFRGGSQLSRLNLGAAEGPVVVEPPLFELLELCMRLWEETGGAFDISATPLWRVWGFARRAGAMPSQEQIAEALGRTGSHLVELDRQRRTVRFRVPGVELSLGSVGKGYAVDRAGAVLQRAGIGDFLVHGGLSSVLGRGSRMVRATGDSAAGHGWSVGISHPLRPGKRLAEIRLHDRALGTSGAANQFFRHQGRRYGHILDPRTGWPAHGVLSATVLAPNATLADALATAFYVMGLEKASQYCRSRPELAAVLVSPVGRGNQFEIHSIGLEAGDLKILSSW